MNGTGPSWWPPCARLLPPLTPQVSLPGLRDSLDEFQAYQLTSTRLPLSARSSRLRPYPQDARSARQAGGSTSGQTHARFARGRCPAAPGWANDTGRVCTKTTGRRPRTWPPRRAWSRSRASLPSWFITAELALRASFNTRQASVWPYRHARRRHNAPATPRGIPSTDETYPRQDDRPAIRAGGLTDSRYSCRTSR